MMDAVLGASAVLLSLMISFSLLLRQKHRSVETRGAAGLAITLVHLFGSLALAVFFSIAFKPASQINFFLGVLVFYWLSLIVLVVTIIRWLRAAASAAASAGANAGESNPRR